MLRSQSGAPSLLRRWTLITYVLDRCVYIENVRVLKVYLTDLGRRSSCELCHAYSAAGHCITPCLHTIRGARFRATLADVNFASLQGCYTV